MNAPIQSSKAIENSNNVTSYNFPLGLLVSGDIGSLRDIDSDYLIIESQYIKIPISTQAFYGEFYFSSVHADVLNIKIIIPSSSDWFIDILYSDGTTLSKTYQDSNWIELGIEIDCQKIVDHIEISSYGDEYLDPFSVKIDQIVLVSTTSMAELKIITPNETELFGTSPPGYEIEISYLFDLETAYYTLNDQISPVYSIDLTSWVSGIKISGTIDIDAWNDLEDGDVVITFTIITYLGTKIDESVVILKDSTSPSIIIFTPENGQEFGTNAPEFQIEVTDESLIESKWYVVENSNPIDFALNFGIIEQSIWDNLDDSESINIEFYAEDKSGNIDKSTVIVSKDSSPPEITINYPSSNQMFSTTPPNYDISINEDVLEFGFIIDNGVEYQLTSPNGNIYQTSWEWLSQGNHQLSFYAIDNQGNKGYNTLDIYKDSIEPELNVITPLVNNVYGLYSPNYSLSIIESNLQDFGYYIDGSSSFILYNLTGRIDQNTWNLLDQGTHSLDFWARDLAGNVQYNSVFISKDTNAPIININSPNYVFYNDIVPNYDIDVFDQNPDEVWYTLNNESSIKYYIYSATGFIDQEAYGACNDGEVLITFFASDIVDNIAQSSVLLIKDSINPQISIISPEISDYFKELAPYYKINVVEENLNEIYYIVNDETYRVYENKGYIDIDLWNSLDDGLINISFIVFDLAGNTADQIVSIVKDTIKPVIEILLPQPFEKFNSSIAPTFILNIIEMNLDKIYYTIGNHSEFYYIEKNCSKFTVEQELWDNMSIGNLDFTFYLQDLSNQTASYSINIEKIEDHLGSDEFDIVELLKMPLPVSVSIFSGAAIIIMITNKIKKKKAN
jgi:hypothetical protein